MKENVRRSLDKVSKDPRTAWIVETTLVFFCYLDGNFNWPAWEALIGAFYCALYWPAFFHKSIALAWIQLQLRLG